MVAHSCLDRALAQARERELRPDEHFSVDRTLSEAWAGQKRFTRQDAVPPVLPPDDSGPPSIDS
jgi:hypothetical protein